MRMRVFVQKESVAGTGNLFHPQIIYLQPRSRQREQPPTQRVCSVARAKRRLETELLRLGTAPQVPLGAWAPLIPLLTRHPAILRPEEKSLLKPGPFFQRGQLPSSCHRAEQSRAEKPLAGRPTLQASEASAGTPGASHLPFQLRLS